MADDSVPLPYPNLKVPQWYHQVQHVPSLKEQASTSLAKAIEADGWLYPHFPWLTTEMAPYLEFMGSDDTALIKSLKEKNEKEIASFDEKVKEAEEQEGESEISELLRSKAMYLCRIGERVGVECALWLHVLILRNAPSPPSKQLSTRQQDWVPASTWFLQKSASDCSTPTTSSSRQISRERRSRFFLPGHLDVS